MKYGTRFDRFTPNQINEAKDKTFKPDSNNRTCFKCKKYKAVLGGTIKHLRSGQRAFICKECLQ